MLPSWRLAPSVSRFASSFFGLATGFVLVMGGAGCGEDADNADETVAVDSSLVDLMVDLHLADAREEVADDPALGDSLRDLVYALHSLDSTQLRIRLDELAQRPGEAQALVAAIETELSAERRSTTTFIP